VYPRSCSADLNSCIGKICFPSLVQGQADARRLADAVHFAAHRPQLLALARRHRLPTVAYGRHDAEAGSLLADGA
jgi:hypothetical protein